MKSKNKDQSATSEMNDFLANFLAGGVTQLMEQLEREAVHRVAEGKLEELGDGGDEHGPKWFYKLDIEIWRHIVGFLVPPRLKPLSGRTRQEYAYEGTSEYKDQRDNFATLPDESEPGCVSREHIRAGDLATLMRTSIAFNQITADHLYRHICCDSLPLLLKGVGGFKWPTHFGIDSKEKLLERTRSLQLEYLSKGDQRHTSYVSLMRRPACWGLLGETWEIAHALHQAADEALHIADRLEEVQRPILRIDPDPYFPNLTHLSIGAIFGGHESMWDGVTHPDTHLVFHNPTGRKEDERPPIKQLVENCQTATMRLFSSSPIIHYCSRSTFGPYAPPIVWHAPVPPSPPSTPSPPPTFTMHLTTVTDTVRAVIGSPTRWLVENHERHLHTANTFVRNFIILLESHHELVQKAGVKNPKFDIDVFMSGSRYVPLPLGRRYLGEEEEDRNAIMFSNLEEEKALIWRIYQANYMQKRSTGMPILQGISSWRSSAESGGCAACGWEFDEAGGSKAERPALPGSGSGRGKHHDASQIGDQYYGAGMGTGGEKPPAKGKGKARKSK